MKAIMRDMIGMFYNFSSRNHNGFIMSLKQCDSEYDKYFLDLVFSIISEDHYFAHSLFNLLDNSVCWGKDESN